MLISNRESYPIAAGIETSEGPRDFRIPGGEELEVSDSEGRKLLALEIGLVEGGIPSDEEGQDEVNLSGMNRSELEEHAADLGIENPGDFSNMQSLREAIEAEGGEEE